MAKELQKLVSDVHDLQQVVATLFVTHHTTAMRFFLNELTEVNLISLAKLDFDGKRHYLEREYAKYLRRKLNE